MNRPKRDWSRIFLATLGAITLVVALPVTFHVATAEAQTVSRSERITRVEFEIRRLERELDRLYAERKELAENEYRKKWDEGRDDRWTEDPEITRAEAVIGKSKTDVRVWFEDDTSYRFTTTSTSRGRIVELIAERYDVNESDVEEVLSVRYAQQKTQYKPSSTSTSKYTGHWYKDEGGTSYRTNRGYSYVTDEEAEYETWRSERGY